MVTSGREEAQMLAREPAVAGVFYPENPIPLQHQIDDMLSSRQGLPLIPKALIVPHAGYIYSGPIAASAYRLLQDQAHKIRRVVLLGPSHQVAFRGIAAPEEDLFHTPLGNISIDRQSIRQLQSQNLINVRSDAHRWEHSLEVQLPFLQRVLGEFALLPLVVGDASPQEVANALRASWGGEETLIVVSSDLSHYHPYSEARQIDRETSAMIESLNGTLNGEQACGCRAVNGLLTLAQEKQLSITTLDVRNSGDTAGDRDRVVGYGAYALC